MKDELAFTSQEIEDIAVDNPARAKAITALQEMSWRGKPGAEDADDTNPHYITDQGVREAAKLSNRYESLNSAAMHGELSESEEEELTRLSEVFHRVEHSSEQVEDVEISPDVVYPFSDPGLQVAASSGSVNHGMLEVRFSDLSGKIEDGVMLSEEEEKEYSWLADNGGDGKMRDRHTRQRRYDRVQKDAAIIAEARLDQLEAKQAQADDEEIEDLEELVRRVEASI